MTKEQIKELHKSLVQLAVIFRQVCEEENIWYSLACGTLLGAVREKKIIDWDTDVDMYVKIEDVERLRTAFEKRNIPNIEYINHDHVMKFLSSHDVIKMNKPEIYHDIHLDIYPIVGAPSDKKNQDRVAFKWSYMDKIIRSKYVNIWHCKPKNRFFVAGAKIVDLFFPDKFLHANINKREKQYDMKKTGYWMILANYGPGRACFPIKYLLESETKELYGEDFNVFKDWNEYLTIMYGDYMTPKKY